MSESQRFESRPEYDAMVERIFTLCEPLNRGDILPHGLIEPVMRCGPNELHWQHVMNRVRTRLRKDREIETRAEFGIGYRLLTVDDQLAEPQWRQKRALRQLRRGMRSLKALSIDNLSTHQRRLREFEMTRVKEQCRKLRERKDWSDLIAKSKPCLPRPELVLAEATP